LRGEHPHAPVARLLDRGPGARLHHPDDRDVERALQGPKGRRRRGVAGDDDHLHVLLDKVAHDLEGEPTDLGRVARPVWNPRRVSEVQRVLVGQPVPYLRENRQPPDTRIENPDWPWIAHGASLYPFNGLPNKRAGTMISFDRNGVRFKDRAAGLCIHDGYVLPTKADQDRYWILPGGRVEIGEDTRAALARAFLEETGQKSGSETSPG